MWNRSQMIAYSFVRWTWLVDGVEDVEIITTFDPEFGPDMMSEDAKMILGIWE